MYEIFQTDSDMAIKNHTCFQNSKYYRNFKSL